MRSFTRWLCVSIQEVTCETVTVVNLINALTGLKCDIKYRTDKKFSSTTYDYVLVIFDVKAFIRLGTVLRGRPMNICHRLTYLYHYY